MRAIQPIHLQMRGIVKRFPGVLALQGVSLDVRGSEVLALMGENGAGKSTLMKVLGGAHAPDEGELLIDGRTVAFRGVADAKRCGIALIHQELMLAPNLDIAGNIFLGNEPSRLRALGLLDSRAMRRRAQELLSIVGLSRDARTRVSDLSPGQMQMVEIARALAMDARVVIMDEPTSSLASAESEHLFRIIGDLRASGVAVVYISHRMEEVLRLADRIAVLRDGRNAGELPAADATQDRIVSLMVGRILSQRFPVRPDLPQDTPEILRLEDVVVPGAPAGVSLNVRRGEILGFAGLVGAGRTELMQVIFGVDRPLGGKMLLNGKSYAPRSPRDAIRAGICLAPEDRKRNGLVLPMSIAQNTSLPTIGGYRPLGWLSRSSEVRAAEKERSRLAIKAPTVHALALNLSGGNQQKVVLGKWLAMDPRILILDEPTRGIDVGARSEIYHHIADLAARGIAVLMVSSDLEEVIGLSDRVAVMHERRLVGFLRRHELTPDRVGMLMTGRTGDAASAAAHNAHATEVL